MSVQTAPYGTDLLIGPALHVRQLHYLADVFDAVHSARGHPQRDAFLGRDESVIKSNNDLACAAQRILSLLVVIVQLEGADRADFTKVDFDRMVLTLVERNQPHVTIITRIILPVEELLKCAMVTAMPRDGVHVSWLSRHISLATLPRFIVHLASLDRNWDGLAAFVQDLQAIKSDVE